MKKNPEFFTALECITLADVTPYLQKPIRCPNWIAKKDVDTLSKQKPYILKGIEKLIEREILYIVDSDIIRDDMLDLAYKLQIHQEGTAESIMAHSFGRLWDRYHTLEENEVNTMIEKRLHYEHDNIVFEDKLVYS